MKRILSLIIVLSISVLSFGQQKELTPRVKKQVEILKNSSLGLNDIQLGRITLVLINEDQILEKNLKALDGNKSQLEARTKELHSIMINNVKGGMTTLQAETFDKLKLGDKL